MKTILSSKDRVVGVQGYAGTGKTTMLDRARQLAAKSGYRTIGVAPPASAARPLAVEAGIETETLQRFLPRNAGIAEGRLPSPSWKETVPQEASRQHASARPSSPARSATMTPSSETGALTASSGMSSALHMAPGVSGAMLSQRLCMLRVSR